MEHLLDDHENNSKQKENSQKLCDEKEPLPLSLNETVYGNSDDNSIRIQKKKATAKGRLASESNKFKRTGL